MDTGEYIEEIESHDIDDANQLYGQSDTGLTQNLQSTNDYESGYDQGQEIEGEPIQYEVIQNLEDCDEAVLVEDDIFQGIDLKEYEDDDDDIFKSNDGLNESPFDQVDIPVVQSLLGEMDISNLSEVVAIITSLGSCRRQFNDCKGIPYTLIDANRDVSVGAGLNDPEYLKLWHQLNLLLPDDVDPTAKYLLPQILIDGVAIGGTNDLQELEENGDLDLIVTRKICGNCLYERNEYDQSCSVCNAIYKNLIAPQDIYERRVQTFLRGCPCDENGELTEVRETSFLDQLNRVHSTESYIETRFDAQEYDDCFNA